MNLKSSFIQAYDPCAVEMIDGVAENSKSTTTTKKKDSRVIQFVKQRMPILHWLPNYNWKRDFHGDLIAGLTVGIMHVPQGRQYVLGVSDYFALFRNGLFFLSRCSSDEWNLLLILCFVRLHVLWNCQAHLNW